MSAYPCPVLKAHPAHEWPFDGRPNTCPGILTARWVPCSEQDFDTWLGPVKMIQGRFHRWMTLPQELAELSQKYDDLSDELEALKARVQAAKGGADDGGR